MGQLLRLKQQVDVATTRVEDFRIERVLLNRLVFDLILLVQIVAGGDPTQRLEAPAFRGLLDEVRRADVLSQTVAVKDVALNPPPP